MKVISLRSFHAVNLFVPGKYAGPLFETLAAKAFPRSLDAIRFVDGSVPAPSLTAAANAATVLANGEDGVDAAGAGGGGGDEHTQHADCGNTAGPASPATGSPPSAPVAVAAAAFASRWDVVDMDAAFRRMGVEADRAWRRSDVNRNYELCQTYPATLYVPEAVSDADLKKAARFRSKGRIPALVYLHESGAVIARSAQPMKGMGLKRSSDDECLVQAVLAGPRTPRRSSSSSSSNSCGGAGTGGAGAASSMDGAGAAVTQEQVRIDELIAQIKDLTDREHGGRFTQEGKALHKKKKARLQAKLDALLNEQEHVQQEHVLKCKARGSSGGGGGNDPFESSGDGMEEDASDASDAGAETTKPYHIVDARPKLNAFANQAAGKGFEHAAHYGARCTVTFLEIDNIHTMRGSIEALLKACQSIAENENPGDATSGAAGAARRGRRGRAKGATTARWSRSSSVSSATAADEAASSYRVPASAHTSTSTSPSPPPLAMVGAGTAIHEEEVAGDAALSSAATSAASFPPRSPAPSNSPPQSPTDAPASGAAKDAGGGGGGSRSSSSEEGSGTLGTDAEGEEGARQGVELGSLDSFAAALRDGIERSHWLLHVRKVLVGAIKIAKLVGQKHESVLVHCSDGWDRTAQLTALAQVLIDPHYRTIVGFNELIQREWLMFGHKFSDRCSMVGPRSTEASPVFTQFLDCVWQLVEHAPTAFEFTGAYLLAIHSGVASRRHGTFLCNTERERLREHDLPSRTACLWAELKAELLVQQLADASTTELLDGGGAAVDGGDAIAEGIYINASYAGGLPGLLAVEFTRQSDVGFFEELYQPKYLPTFERTTIL